MCQTAPRQEEVIWGEKTSFTRGMTVKCIRVQVPGTMQSSDLQSHTVDHRGTYEYEEAS